MSVRLDAGRLRGRILTLVERRLWRRAVDASPLREVRGADDETFIDAADAEGRSRDVSHPYGR